KGVQITHRALVNFLTSMQQAPGISADDTLLSVTTLSFDIAGLEIFLPLLNGARVVLASRETLLNGSQLARLIESSRATVMQATPATWRLLLEAEWSGSQQLKLLCGGEALPGELAARLLERSAGLWNLYGPTETTIYSALKRVETVNRDVVELGRPIANTQLYVLDQSLQPVPQGVAGELFIGGAGLARGYLKRAELTAERFIPDPFSATAGARLYRTGDRTRYLRDGQLEFLGRIDHQVKVRGYRIELGEVEAALREQEGVRECVVVARQEGGGAARLVGYVVLEEEASLSVTALRQGLSQRLPEYMIPASFMQLEELPLTANGKLDRRALPDPGHQRPALETERVGPSTPVEETLVRIWSEVLGLNEVGIHDNFFELGGDSILSIQIVARANQAGLRLAPKHLFQYQTVAELALMAEQAAAAVDDNWARVKDADNRAQDVAFTPSDFPTVNLSQEQLDKLISKVSRANVEDILSLSPMQKGLLFHSLYAPDAGVYFQQVHCVLRGNLDLQAFRQAWQQSINRHSILRTSFFWEDLEEPVQVVNREVTLPIEVEDWRELSDSEQQSRFLDFLEADRRRGFELSSAPLLRLVLLRLDEQRYRLVWSHHHLLLDGW
ncbi:MAG TPA: AMP-binding protein, partial [Pyrinomonadaceae bacterium]|nr:AMP-binding protein [Pyrinomonadaceae bacterium]